MTLHFSNPPLVRGAKCLGENSCDVKSDNLQFNMLGRWDNRLIDQASDVQSIIFDRG